METNHDLTITVAPWQTFAVGATLRGTTWWPWRCGRISWQWHDERLLWGSDGHVVVNDWQVWMKMVVNGC